MRTPTTKLPAKSPQSNHQLRIIGGRWRGRKLGFPAIEGLRPTGDRIRETLFNWLAPELADARCLDIFAGSGALGLEALSRGAAMCVLCELNAHAAAQLQAHLCLLQATGGKIVHRDSLTYLREGNTEAPFDVVFIDPPFALNLWQPTIDALETGNWLANNASIYIEASKDTLYTPPATWKLHRDKQAGHVNYRLYYRSVPSN